MEISKIRKRKAVASKYEIPSLVSRFLKCRDLVNEDDQIEFLTPSLKDLKSPFKLYGMTAACKRLLLALKHDEQIGVYCDYDLDGSSGAAILIEGFKSLGFKEPKLYQPRRLTEGYGFHKAGVDFFKEEGVSVIVTVDVAITAHKTALYAKEEGIDLIITDHHLADDTLPEALAVINPNIKECSARLGHLCGAGVGFYLIYGLAKMIKEETGSLPEGFKIDELLDFLVIGTLTDMVPLIKENRALVKQGLIKFSSTPRAGLRALKASLDLLGKTIDSNDIGFKLAPKLNALSRLDTDLRPTGLLLETDREKAEVIVTEALSVNEKRVELLQNGLEEAKKHFQEAPPEDLVFYTSKNIHPGVMGLIATRLVETFGVPAFIGSELSNGQIVGSARLPNGTGLSLKVIMGECPSLIQYGGHAEAAGFELKLEKSFDFYKELKVYLKSVDLDEMALMPEYDCEALLEELDKDFLIWLKRMEPFGVGFKRPSFKLSRLHVTSLRKLKDRHWKIGIKDQKGNESSVLWFSPTKSHDVHMLFEEGREKEFSYNFYVEPQVNFFRKVESLQFLLREVEVSL